MVRAVSVEKLVVGVYQLLKQGRDRELGEVTVENDAVTGLFLNRLNGDGATGVFSLCESRRRHDIPAICCVAATFGLP